jgi:hypothetical protein
VSPLRCLKLNGSAWLTDPVIHVSSLVTVQASDDTTCLTGQTGGDFRTYGDTEYQGMKGQPITTTVLHGSATLNSTHSQTASASSRTLSLSSSSPVSPSSSSSAVAAGQVAASAKRSVVGPVVGGVVGAVAALLAGGFAFFLWRRRRRQTMSTEDRAVFGIDEDSPAIVETSEAASTPPVPWTYHHPSVREYIS